MMFACLALCAQGQNVLHTLTIKGAIIDSAAGTPVSYVTVAVEDVQTKSSIKETLSKDDGSFELSVPSGKSYQLALAYVGYKNKLIAIARVDSIIDMGKVTLAASTKQLAVVSITAVKPLMKQEVDRLNYDVQADPESKIINALDMIRKVPLLSVDGSDNIKLRGNSNYKILINGKESSLMAVNPSDVLKSMPASNIEKIEVITTPPAKYDAEGLAGIINIITKKNSFQGYTGNLSTNYNSVYGYRVNARASIKEGKIAYSGFVSTSERPYIGADYENLSSFYNPVPSSTYQTGTNFNGAHSFINSNELSYELDSLNLFSATFNYNQNNSSMGGSQSTTTLNNNSQVTQAYQTQNNGTGSNEK